MWAVQLLGRWGGDTVKRYVGETALSVFTRPPGSSRAGEHAHLDLATVLGDTADRVAGPSLPARVDAAVALLSDRLKGELLEAMRSELRVELAGRIPPPTTAPRPTDTAEQGTSPAPAWVQNTRTKVFHHSAVGPDSGLPPAQWTARCGWAYGFHGGFVF